MYRDPVAGGVRIFAGAMVALDGSGHAVAARKQPGIRARGMALREADNRQGGDGDCYVEVESGCFGLKTDGQMSRHDIGREVYFADDQTVTASSDGLSLAGILKDLEGEGHDAIAWVLVG
jgi:hypothetical protein